MGYREGVWGIGVIKGYSKVCQVSIGFREG